jgi:hypothetical protein
MDWSARTADAPDFSMVLGGPLYQLYLRARLVRPPLDLLGRRILVITLITWLPLLVLAIFDGRAWGGARIPFLYDVEVQARLLVSLPLLILSEVLVHKRIRSVVPEFLERGLVVPEQRSQFLKTLETCGRLRNSVWAELLLIALAVTLGQWVWLTQVSLREVTWYADPQGAKLHFTPSGIYFAFVSMTVFRFILLRWYFRLLIWWLFLWQVSRLDLKLNPMHPDKAAGLGFLPIAASALMPVLVAQSVLLSGFIAERIFFEGARLPQFRLEILAMLLFFLMIALGPLLVFTPKIWACRRTATIEYGRLASQYVSQFHQKWVGGKSDGEPLLGSGDIQSLADFGNSYEIIRGTTGLPFGKQAVINLAVVCLIPIAPLVLTNIPLNELIDRLVKSIF